MLTSVLGVSAIEHYNLEMTAQDTWEDNCRPARTEMSTDGNNNSSENGSDVANLHDLCELVPHLFAACDDSYWASSSC